MRRWILPSAALALAALVPFALLAGNSSPRPTSSSGGEFPPVEVGKMYGFGVSGSDLTGKVLERPEGGWLKVEIRDDGKARAVWLNLRQVSYITPDPPPETGRRGCTPGSAGQPSL